MDCYSEQYGAFEDASRNHFNNDVELYLEEKGWKDRLEEFRKIISRGSSDSPSYIKTYINKDDHLKELYYRYLSEINTAFVLCSLLDDSHGLCWIVTKKAFEILDEIIVSDEVVSPDNIYKKAQQLPMNVAVEFLMACADNSTLAEKLVSAYRLKHEKDFIKLINEIGIESFPKRYSLLCIAVDFEAALKAHTDRMSPPSLDKYIKNNDYESYAHWISHIYAYLVYDLDNGRIIEQHPEFVNWQITINAKKPKKDPILLNQITGISRYVDRDLLIERLISDDWVVQPDKFDEYSLEDMLRFFFYDKNDKSLEIDKSHSFKLKWNRHILCLHHLIVLIFNENKNVAKQDILDNMDEYGMVSQKYMSLGSNQSGYYDILKNIFENAGNVHKTSIDKKTRNTEPALAQVKAIIDLYFDCKEAKEKKNEGN